jgi:hypothetical protein
MSKVVIIKPNEAKNEISGHMIPMGQYFLGRIAEYEDLLFVRAYSEIVSLKDPTHTWNHEVMIKNYRPVDV